MSHGHLVVSPIQTIHPLISQNTQIGFGELLATVQASLRFSVQNFGGFSGFILIKEGADEVLSKARIYLIAESGSGIFTVSPLEG